MTLNEKDRMTLSYLLKLERRIRDVYKSSSRTFDFKGLTGLVDMETDLIKELNLDDKKLDYIEKFLVDRAEIQLDTKLLIGTSPHLNLNNYPFYRLIARARYLLDERTDIETAFLTPRFKDVEVLLFYRALSNQSKNIPNFRRETQRYIRENLERYKVFIMIDSPYAELELLKNGLEPVEIVYDSIDFDIDVFALTIYKMIFLSNPNRNRTFDYDVFYSSHKDRIRLLWFNSRYKIVMEELIKIIKSYEEDPRLSPYFLLLVAFAKSLIAMLNKEMRLEVYRDFVANEKLENLPFPWFSSWLDENVKDIEENLAPTIWRARTKKYLQE